MSTETRDTMFQPAWAKETLGTNNVEELRMYREFFDAWESMHATPEGKNQRREMELRAEILMQHARAVWQSRKRVNGSSNG